MHFASPRSRPKIGAGTWASTAGKNSQRWARAGESSVAAGEESLASDWDILENGGTIVLTKQGAPGEDYREEEEVLEEEEGEHGEGTKTPEKCSSFA